MSIVHANRNKLDNSYRNLRLRRRVSTHGERRTRIRNVNTGETYRSISEAAYDAQVSYSTMAYAISRPDRLVYGQRYEKIID